MLLPFLDGMVADVLVEIYLLAELGVKEQLELLHVGLVAVCTLVYGVDLGVDAFLVLRDAFERVWHGQMYKRLANFEHDCVFLVRELKLGVEVIEGLFLVL